MVSIMPDTTSSRPTLFTAQNGMVFESRDLLVFTLLGSSEHPYGIN